MFILIINSLVYSVLIICSFNLLPYKWLCDYNSNSINLSSHKKISLHIFFLPVFVFTFASLFLTLISCNSPLQIFIQITMILLLTHISLSDILYMIIPDQHILIIFVLGILNISSNTIFLKLIGFVSGALPFFILLIIGFLLNDEEWIGFGDIKLMSALGFLLGYSNILTIYMVSSLLSSICIIILILPTALRKKNNTIKYLPFAPFISFASLFCMIL